MSARAARSTARSRGTRSRRPGRLRRLLRFVAALVLLLALALGAGALWVWHLLDTPYAGFTGEQHVRIEPGESGTAILTTLDRAGVILDARLARLWLLAHGDPPLQAGEYLFRPPLTTAEALGKVIRGEVVAHRATVPEGLTLDETADRLVAAGLGDRDALLAAMRAPESIADLDPEAKDLEGYLFPDSYTFATNTAARAVVAAMVADFRRRWQATVASRLPLDGGRTVREVVILASIVEKEARAPAERPLIAAVYANRLQRGMGLFADPTIIYALKRLGRWNGNVRRADLALDSPYNTYRHAGLPPGPICSPGVESLLAAARPADVPYLYFVSRNDGTHVFATSLDEHNRNVATWQRRYWRDRRAAAAPTPTPARRRRRR